MSYSCLYALLVWFYAVDFTVRTQNHTDPVLIWSLGFKDEDTVTSACNIEQKFAGPPMCVVAPNSKYISVDPHALRVIG